MAVYMIVETKEVMDGEKYREYIKKVPWTIEKFGGKYLTRGGKVEIISGNWRPERLIVITFHSMRKFIAWWNSPEYKAIAPLREESAKTNAIVVQGL